MNQSVTVALNDSGQYQVTGTDASTQVDVDRILGKARYPRRLMKGLDDIALPDLRDALERGRILAVGLRLTNVCNYDCIYCGTAARRGRDGAGVLSTAEYFDLIDQAADLGARTIIFGANGEPLMTKDVIPIFERVAQRGMTPLTFSNVSVIGHDALCRKLHGCSGTELLQRLDAAGTTLIVSTETIQRARYDHIMGVQTYDYFCRAIERIRHDSTLTHATTFAGHPLCRLAVSCVVMPINYDERHVMADFAHGLNGLIVLKPPSLHGSAATNSEQMFSVEEARRIRPELEELSDKQATLQILTLACASWTLSFSIDNEGNFMSCMTEEVNPFTDANIRTVRLADRVGRRNELVKLANSICPVKDKYYVRSADLADHDLADHDPGRAQTPAPAQSLLPTTALVRPDRDRTAR